ncbi:NFATC2-interacting protein isoform X1 [Amphiprion ocellaris]|uniref:NFATC2-interacting protein isoform X1 n=1 Tax=Amphiprion ocellaris TaxID=80972 RepID=UPI0024114A78|nr:NFATC2-interacting protein isoform X1 [Amphiprion ocellaris]
MADACFCSQVSDGEVQPAKPKRRRILDPSAIVPVPVYSNKVSSSLQLKPTAALFATKPDSDDGADDSLWSEFSSRETPPPTVTLSDSEDEAEPEQDEAEKQPEAVCCPSPPPETPVQKQSRKVQQKINEIDRRLRAVSSLLSPECQNRTTRRRRCRSSPPTEQRQDDIIAPNTDDDIIITSPNDDNDDVIIMSPEPQSSEYSQSVREIPLKIRCRTDVHKIPVLSSTPLSDVVSQLSLILSVPPPRLLLLREEVELPMDATVSELGLGIADIIECVVMAAEDKSEACGGSIITVRLQSKDRDSSQEFSLDRGSPLGSIFSQYLSTMSAGNQKKVRFHFDGCKVTNSQTPAQLDMEDGDIIEVWT